MPLRRYDKQLGKKKGSAQRTLDQMKARYGEKGRRSVFYATVNKRRGGRRSLTLSAAARGLSRSTRAGC